jgi:two-component system cell cycle sensor histidine kinase/response regulator CckA
MSDPVTTPLTEDRLIYLVDDEEELLDLAEVSLLAGGYELKKFQNPEEAYAAFAREERKPSLLLTDYAMDSMNGLELSEKCKSACPGLKILMVSGTAGPDVLVDSPGTVDEFMAKPYRPSELAATVRTLLDT